MRISPYMGAAFDADVLKRGLHCNAKLSVEQNTYQTVNILGFRDTFIISKNWLMLVMMGIVDYLTLLKRGVLPGDIWTKVPKRKVDNDYFVSSESISSLLPVFEDGSLRDE